MRVSIRLATVGLTRAPLRTLLRIVVLAGAVALLGAMVLFIGHSLRTMTTTSVNSVPLDWQGPVSSYRQARRVAAGVAAQAGVAQASPAATAPFARAVHISGSASTGAGSGSILAVPPGYLNHIQTFRMLNGRLGADGIVLDQQLAATLQARIGNTVSITPRAGARPVGLRVTGVALITASDTVFQPLNPLLGPAPAQPPANAAIMPLATFAHRIAPELAAIGSGPAGAGAVPGAQTGVQWQVQAQVNPHSVAGSPAHALTVAGGIVHRVERSLPGQVQFVDNLSDSLTTAAGDALYAETLYIMLALPGALIALNLAYLAALGTVDRDRRELALLRARGATRRHLLGHAAAESVVLGVVAGVLGAGMALGAVSWLGRTGQSLSPGRAGLTAGVCVAVAILGGLVTRLAATRSVLRASISDSRLTARREPRPLWRRLYLDVAALVVSGLIYWLTASTGFAAVINPDANPTLSLSVYMFFAPALLWVGATLLLVRLRGRMIAWAAGRVSGGRADTPAAFLLASLGRRGSALNRGLLAAGLLLAFGVELGLFTATYDRQASVDAQLTLGADVTATAPPGVTAQHGLGGKIAALPGVSGTTPVDHSYAYVGPDLQDTFGIDARTFTRASTLRDSYFPGLGATRALAALRARPDGILVSKETINDYQLRRGDLLNLRVLDHRSGRFRIVPFHVSGVVQEFPSAPRDSFMVANLAYLQAVDRAGGPNQVFIRASDPARVAAAVARATRVDGTLVSNIEQQAHQTSSSITTVDLRGVSRIEEAFTVALVAAAMGLFVALTLIERRQEFATMAALGAGVRTIGSFLWSEAALVLLGGLVLAATLGLLLALMLIALLQHVFDPPPDALTVPWAYLAELCGGAVATTVIVLVAAHLRLSRLPLGRLLREQ
jgi:putative ABC transport system permease protein